MVSEQPRTNASALACRSFDIQPGKEHETRLVWPSALSLSRQLRESGHSPLFHWELVKTPSECPRQSIFCQYLQPGFPLKLTFVSEQVHKLFCVQGT